MHECTARIEVPPVFSKATRGLMRAAVLAAGESGDRTALLRAPGHGCAAAYFEGRS